MKQRALVFSTEHGWLDKASRDKRHPTGTEPVQQDLYPGKHGIRIRREKKGRRGKTVTVIEGLPLNETALKKMLRNFKAQLGTGGTVKSGCLEFQGDHRNTLLQLLGDAGFKAKLAGG
jgi:translation initiation factor 1